MNMLDFVKGLLAMPDLSRDAADFAIGKAQKILETEKAESKAFEAELKQMSVDELKTFIPDIYQENIYKWPPIRQSWRRRFLTPGLGP